MILFLRTCRVFTVNIADANCRMWENKKADN